MSGEQFSKTENDWKFYHASIPEQVKAFFKDGFKLVIFTNQMGVQKGILTYYDLFKKFRVIQQALQVEMTFVASTHLDYNRKPSPLLFKAFSDHIFATEKAIISYEDSFYCGDSAGRSKNPITEKADLSDSDIKFALNIGIKYRTPEEVFEIPVNQENQNFPDLALDKKYNSVFQHF